MIQKIFSLGFSNEIIDWLTSYHSSKNFHVNINDKFSASPDLRCGVPRGSKLGNMLFLLNDMAQAIYCDLFLYADDVCYINIKI